MISFVVGFIGGCVGFACCTGLTIYAIARMVKQIDNAERMLMEAYD